jgi:hypothetical protein
LQVAASVDRRWTMDRSIDQWPWHQRRPRSQFVTASQGRGTGKHAYVGGT